MTAPKTKYPIASFGPELMAFLTKSGREKVVLRFEGERGFSQASIFRRRIHTLRQQMRIENHPDHKFAARAKVRIVFGDAAVDEGGPKEWAGDDSHHRGALVIGQPHDMEFNEVLQQADLEIRRPSGEPTYINEEKERDRPKSRFGGLLDELEGLMTPPVPPEEKK